MQVKRILFAPAFAMSTTLYGAASAETTQQAPQAPIHVSVQGNPIGWGDIIAFMRGFYEQSQQSPRIKLTFKAAAAMPPDAPYVSYQGRETGTPSTEIIWMSMAAAPLSTADPNYEEKSEKVGEEYVAAAALAVMDAGKAGPTLEAIYAKTPADRETRLALGESFAQAFQAASDQSAAFAAGEANWIRSHIAPGTLRSEAYQMLRSKGLTAYNDAFVKGKPVPPPETQSGDRVTFGASCDTSDRSSGAWPFKGEPLPRLEGACAQMFATNPKSIPNPDAEITLAGAFSIACDSVIRIVVRFTDADRVKAVDISQPRSMCI